MNRPDIKFKCPRCSQPLEAPEDMLGQLIDCPSCNQAIEVTRPQMRPSGSPINYASLPKNKAQQYAAIGAKAPAEKSIPLAIGLNLVLPGVGYMYMGRVLLGICVLILTGGIYAGTAMLGFFYAWGGLNLIMAIDMLILGRKREKEIAAATTKVCPKCAESIKRDAKVCRFCGADVSRVF